MRIEGSRDSLLQGLFAKELSARVDGSPEATVRSLAASLSAAATRALPCTANPEATVSVLVGRRILVSCPRCCCCCCGVKIALGIADVGAGALIGVGAMVVRGAGLGAGPAFSADERIGAAVGAGAGFGEVAVGAAELDGRAVEGGVAPESRGTVGRTTVGVGAAGAAAGVAATGRPAVSNAAAGSCLLGRGPLG